MPSASDFPTDNFQNAPPTPPCATAPRKDSRAQSGSATRRRQVKGYPIHGYQQEQPSDVTGSGASDDEVTQEKGHVNQSATHA